MTYGFFKSSNYDRCRYSYAIPCAHMQIEETVTSRVGAYGALTPRCGGSPVAIPSQPPSRRVRRLRHSLPACSRPGRRASGRGRETPAMRGRVSVPSGMLTDTMAGRGVSGLLGPVHAARLHVAVPRGDRPTCEG